MKIVFESSDIPAVFDARVTEAIEQGANYHGRHGQFGADGIRVCELEFWNGVVYDSLQNAGLCPWDKIRLYIPHVIINSTSGPSTYTCGKFTAKHCRVVGNYWHIKITASSTKLDRVGPVTELLFEKIQASLSTL